MTGSRQRTGPKTQALWRGWISRSLSLSMRASVFTSQRASGNGQRKYRELSRTRQLSQNRSGSRRPKPDAARKSEPLVKIQNPGQSRFPRTGVSDIHKSHAHHKPAEAAIEEI
ncbi:hypothetical protein AAFF_G00424810 [Aldrovandia affinis]|uniref:Uncharacterized protein n=1 Tax=Aldrovandia affinis TaxID=143900 RepID=A0AAD7T6V5_9TELE|nr:hypothetical protein AAFF_G00424810 [Aldrovandia affinis]